MDTLQSEGSFLSRCSKFTSACLFAAAGLLLLMLLTQGISNFEHKLLSEQNSMAQIPFSALEDKTASSKSYRISAQTDEVIQTHIHNGYADTNQPQSMLVRDDYLHVDNIVLDAVVTLPHDTELQRVIVYFSNCSRQSGLVQLKSVAGDSGGNLSVTEQWERRRLPRLDYLIYSMYVPHDMDLSTITLYLRSQVSGDVREFQLASHRPRDAAQNCARQDV